MMPSRLLLKARTVLKCGGGLSPANTMNSTVVFSPDKQYTSFKQWFTGLEVYHSETLIKCLRNVSKALQKAT